MGFESSILPVRSELVMPRAGYWAAKGQMSFPVAVICGVLGSIIGALANYFGAQLIGRPLLQRYGREVLFRVKKLPRVLSFFSPHAQIRQLHSPLFSASFLLPFIFPL